MFDHMRTDRLVPFSRFAIAICFSLLVAGQAFAGVTGPDFRPPFDFDQSGSSDVLLTRTSGSPNLGINETNISSGSSFSARGWPDLNSDGVSVVYETLSAGVFDGNGFDKAQILTIKNSGMNIGLLRIVETDAAGTAPGTIPSQYFVGGPGAGWSFLGVGDCDGNGTDDIVFYDTVAGTIRILFMNVAGDFTVSSTQDPGALGADNTPIGVGDADGDGQADIWTRDTVTDGVEILINAPDVATGGVFESGQMPTSVPTDYDIAGIGIFNPADAQADIVFEKNANPNAGLVRINHTGTDGGATGAPPVAFPALLDQVIGETVVTVGDYDGANQSDLLTRLLTPTNSANEGALTVRLLNAAGTDLAGGAYSPSNWSNSLDYTVVNGAPQ